MKKIIKVNPSALKKLVHNIEPDKPIKINVGNLDRILATKYANKNK